MAKSKEELKSLLRRVKKESEKVGLELNIPKIKIVVSSLITSWQVNGRKVEIVTDFIFLGSKITVDGDFSQEIKRHSLEESYYNLDSVWKSTDITLPTKVHIAKAMVFPVVRYKCKSWTVKKVECWRIYVLELWDWRGFLRVPWTARRSNQSILKEISPEYSLEGLILEAEIPILWPPDSKSWFTGKGSRFSERLKAREGDDRGCDRWMASLTQWIGVRENSWRWWRIMKPGVLQFMELQRVRHDLVTNNNLPQRSFWHFWTYHTLFKNHSVSETLPTLLTEFLLIL